MLKSKTKGRGLITFLRCKFEGVSRNREGLGLLNGERDAFQMKRIIIDATAINLERLGFYGVTGNWLARPSSVKSMQSFVVERRRCLPPFSERSLVALSRYVFIALPPPNWFGDSSNDITNNILVLTLMGIFNLYWCSISHPISHRTNWLIIARALRIFIINGNNILFILTPLPRDSYMILNDNKIISNKVADNSLISLSCQKQNRQPAPPAVKTISSWTKTPRHAALAGWCGA